MALVEMQTAMMQMEPVGKVCSLASSVIKSIDFAISTWIKAKKRKDLATQESVNLILERQKDHEED